jgi:hypothetical protein
MQKPAQAPAKPSQQPCTTPCTKACLDLSLSSFARDAQQVQVCAIAFGQVDPSDQHPWTMIVSAVSILVKVGKALKESGGAATEYQEAVDFLNGVGKTLTGIQTILQNNPNLKWEPELIEQAERLKAAVEIFKKKIDKYDLSLGADTERKKARRIPREIQFALSDQVKELRAAISQPQIVLGVFIGLQNL